MQRKGDGAARSLQRIVPTRSRPTRRGHQERASSGYSSNLHTRIEEAHELDPITLRDWCSAHAGIEDVRSICERFMVRHVNFYAARLQYSESSGRRGLRTQDA